MKKCSIIALLLALLLLPQTAGARSYTWQPVESAVQVRADGVLEVTETLTLRYDGGPFTFAFRDLPERRLDGISAISVREGDRVFRQVDDEESSEPFTFSVFREDGAQRVRWVYPETMGGERTFTLRYMVAGAVCRNAENNEVWRSVVFGEREGPVAEGFGRISLPETAVINRTDSFRTPTEVPR